MKNIVESCLFSMLYIETPSLRLFTSILKKRRTYFSRKINMMLGLKRGDESQKLKMEKIYERAHLIHLAASAQLLPTVQFGSDFSPCDSLFFVSESQMKKEVCVCV